MHLKKIALAPAEDFRRDSDLFAESVRNSRPDAGRVRRSDRTASLTMHSLEQHPCHDLIEMNVSHQPPCCLT